MYACTHNGMQNGVYKRTQRRMYRSVVVGEALTLARCGHADAMTVAIVAVALTIIAPDFITGALALSSPLTAWYVSVVGKSRYIRIREVDTYVQVCWYLIAKASLRTFL